jgi:ribose 5-phosphate isomerase B
MKIAIGGDHAGFEYKAALIKYLEAKGIEMKDFGPYSTASVDYPDYVHPVATAVEDKAFDYGILICGSANGVAITANKHKGIRAGIAWAKELAMLTRQHNNANILCLPARFITLDAAKECVDAFITTSFEGGRHEARVNKIPC